MSRSRSSRLLVASAVTLVLAGPDLAHVVAQDETSKSSALPAGNLGYAGSVEACGNRLLIARSESESGGLDLNGDGDAVDRLAHVEFLASGTGLTLPVSTVGPLRFAGEHFVVMRAHEKVEGRDLNGDGDLADQVLHVHDLRTNALTNLGLALVRFRVQGELLVFLVPELWQGTDLNGDGDRVDNVAHVHDLRAGGTTNLTVASGDLEDLLFDGQHLAIAVTEAFQGRQDLNGDGQATSKVLHLYDTATRELVNTRLPVEGGRAWTFSAGRFVLNVPEEDHGVDLDGDGELRGQVVSLYDPATRILSPTGLAWESHPPVAVTPMGRWVLLTLHDGSRYVLHRLDVTTGTFQDLALPLGTLTDVTLVAGTQRAAFLVMDESTYSPYSPKGKLHVIDVPTSQVTDLGLIGFKKGFVGEGDVVACRVDESATGGGGDIFLELDSGMIHEPGFRVYNPVPGSELVGFRVSETYEGDLNGDGDPYDYVLHAFDLREGTVTYVGVARPGFLVNGRRLAFVVDEKQAGPVDLNRDGDTDDGVVHVVEL